MSEITKEQVAREFLELKLIKQQKIGNDRRKLMNRMSSSSMHEPFPIGAFEKLARNNIWETVLERLDPASLASAHSCCESFKSLSEETLLVHVMSILKDKGWLRLKLRNSNNAFHRRNNHKIWNLRLVSKSWKRATEQVFLNEFSDPSWYVNYPSVSPLHRHPMALSILKESEVKEVNRSAYLKPPIFGQASDVLRGSVSGAHLCQVVLLSSGWVQATLDFLNNLNHGGLIQGVHLHITRNFMRPVDRYMLLVKYLRRMANLKWLIINNQYHSPSDMDIYSDLLRQRIKQFPIPTIPALEFLKFENKLENELILNEILRANPHVKSLELPGLAPITCSVANQLKCLSGLIAYKAEFVNNDNISQLTTVLALGQMNWPLRHLQIGLIDFVSISTDTLFDLINRFGSTLETLKLKWLRLEIEHRHRLELPNLRNMEFNGIMWIDSDAGLDFLLPCRSLELLHLVDLTRIEDTSAFTVHIGDGDVWEWFPKLVCLRIKFQTYSRQIRRRRQEHFVRSGRSVVKRDLAWDCEVRCKKSKFDYSK